MRRMAVLAGLIVVVAGCGGVRPEQVDDGSPERCDAEAGSVTEVATEPDWRFRAYFDWADRDDCLVRIDVITDHRGSDHCNEQSARVITTGTPLGERFTNREDSSSYIRDPKGAYGVPAFTEDLDLDADLPDAAEDTGFRQADTELWAVPDDPSAIYLVDGDDVERWPAGDPPPCM